MKSVLKLLCCLIVLAVMLAVPAGAEEPAEQATILFTHDLHSHLLPTVDENGDLFGGYDRLTTLIRQQKEQYPHAILVDAGDFSMGSLFQTAYADSAVDLRMMGAMGYDVTALGNHEFDYLTTGLASMLTAASRYDTPAIVNANYHPREDEGGQLLHSAMETYGVKDYYLLERGEICFAVFGLLGVDADACIPDSGMILEDPIAAARRTVDAAVTESRERFGKEPIVIALSHCGTYEEEGEDIALAEAVPEIDLIVSGHVHLTLEEPIRVGDTWIVAAGDYGRALGVVQLEQRSDGSTVLADYQLLPVDDTVEPQEDIKALIESFKEEVETNYLSDYGMTFDQVLVQNVYPFENASDLQRYAHESTLGNLFSDAYRTAASRELGYEVDVAVTLAGVVRESIPQGDVTVSNIFNAASIGVGTEGELVEVWLTGKDLMTAMEVDASVFPLMNAAQLFYSGVEYSFNTSRMIFDKVDYAMLRRPDGSLEPIQEDKLYSLTCGMYLAQMLGTLDDLSMGLLSITPRDSSGDPLDLDRLEDRVIHNEEGRPLKEWFAIASYLQDMEGSMDPDYAQPDGRKTVYSSLNPVKLLANANHFTWIALGAAAFLAILTAGIIILIRRRRRARRK